MGFDQTRTTRHFKLLPDGGTIQISANDPLDLVTRNAIRQHLANIAATFGQGNFDVPGLIHRQKPSEVDTMSRLKDNLSYAVESLPTGGRLHIRTTNSEARNAVHDFLRAQIQEHRTGDLLEETGPAKRQHPANNLGHDAPPAPP